MMNALAISTLEMKLLGEDEKDMNESIAGTGSLRQELCALSKLGLLSETLYW